MKRKILITCALPYANGPIHLGHMLEHIEADVYSRFQKMLGNQCLFICADDTHGTPIMIKAKELGITPEQLIAKSQADHLRDFSGFMIGFDNYGSTNSLENKELCELFYSRMYSKKHIHKKPIDQLFCEHDKMFLPDRFVKGTCPKCKSIDQYGDSCDVCGATYSPQELISPKCSICTNTPITKSSEHIFFKLNDFKSYLEQWLPAHTSNEVSKKMLEWFGEDLRDWDISRDEPYFGFPIPNEKNKYFYVWVDAPMGYISSTAQWCKLNSTSLEEFWSPDSKVEIYHFIGKDIVYFHTLFWPALLKSADFKSPNKIHVHGHVMVNGEKMSKSKGTFISAETYLEHLDPQHLRYYYSTKLSASIDDLDLNLDDFAARVNSDLVGKIVNLASRGAQMLTKKMDSTLSSCDEEGLNLIKKIRNSSKSILNFYDRREYSKVTTLVRELAEDTNKYFDQNAPWKTLDLKPAQTKQVLTSTLNAYRLLAIYLSPILPKLSQQTSELFNEKPYTWDSLNHLLENIKINDYLHLATRIDSEKIKAMLEEQKRVYSEAQKNTAPKKQNDDPAPQLPEIEFEDFAKIDLRIATIVEAEEIKEADKLLKIKVELETNNFKQIIAGIKSSYKPENLIGRKVLICANLKPRKMKFGMSEAMILAASSSSSDLFLLSADSGAISGSKVK